MPWISCYGGKLTGCTRMADTALRLIETSVAATGEARTGDNDLEEDAHHLLFPVLAQQSVSAQWCAEHELCCTLEDYLRRRTNIAQWVARGGLGKDDANAQILKDISAQIANGDANVAAQLFETYRRKVENELDPLLA